MITVHADLVGHLLRPPELLKAREQLAAGTISAAQLKQIEDRAVDGAIALHEEAGLEVLTDGEMRRDYMSHPILDPQARNTLELFHVVGYKPDAEAKHVGSDQQVHRANRTPSFFQDRPGLAVGNGSLPVECGDFQGRNKLLQRFTIPSGLPAFARPVFQFRERDNRDPQVADRKRPEPSKHGLGLLLDDVNADVGIEHDFHEKARSLF